MSNCNRSNINTAWSGYFCPPSPQGLWEDPPLIWSCIKYKKNWINLSTETVRVVTGAACMLKMLKEMDNSAHRVSGGHEWILLQSVCTTITTTRKEVDKPGDQSRLGEFLFILSSIPLGQENNHQTFIQTSDKMFFCCSSGGCMITSIPCYPMGV